MRTLFKKTLCLAAILCGGAAMQAQTLVRVKRAGSLEKMAEELALDTCSYISVSGRLNSADIRVLRRLGGYDGDGGKTGRLLMLDLHRARFVTDKEPFMELDIRKERLAGAVQAESAYIRSGWTPPPSRSSGHTAHIAPLNGLDNNEYMLKDLRYKPVYFLNHNWRNGPLKLSGYVKTQKEYKTKIFPCESTFDATKGIGDDLWALLCEKKVTDYKGLVLERRADGSCILKMMSRKGQFPPATFYKCRQLRVVALPTNIRFAPDIYDEDNRIAYFIGPILFRWDRREIPVKVQDKLRRQTDWCAED